MIRWVWVGILCAVLAACESVPESERPAPLPPYTAKLTVRPAWSYQTFAWRSPPEGDLQPVVAHGVVVAADGHNWLRAFNALNGRLRWERRTKTLLGGGLTVSRGLVLVGTHNAEVRAYRLNKGRMAWRARVGGEVWAPIAANGDVAVVRAGDDKVMALNLRNGQRLWTFEQPLPSLTLWGTGAPVIAGPHVYVGFASGTLICLSLQDGHQVWETPVAVPQGRSELERLVDVDATPLVTKETVYAAAYQGRLIAAARDTGHTEWERELSTYLNMAMDDKAIYITDASGAIWALDRHGGAALWKQTLLHNRAVSSPVLQGNYLVVSDFAGYLHWLSREDGQLVGRFHVDDKGTVGAPVIAGGLAYVVGRSGVLEALRVQ